TPSTIVHPGALVERIQQDHAQGFSIVDEELERALRSIAVPILTRNGRNVGAINVSTTAARMTRNELRERVLPRMIAIRDRIAPLPVYGLPPTTVRILLTRQAPAPIIRPHYEQSFAYRTQIRTTERS